MDKYRTSHQGIAAYLVTKGFTILRSFEDVNHKTNRPCVFIEFDMDRAEGKRLGDDFFEGRANGNLKKFHDAGYDVRQSMKEARDSSNKTY